MSQVFLSPFAALVLSVLFPADGAQEAERLTPAEAAELVRQAAFDPTAYFPSQYGRDRSVIRIAYTGDDYGWPVYSLAIALGCLDGETNPHDACGSRVRARMVRAPSDPDVVRPRHAGARLVARVRETGVRTPQEVGRALSEMDLEWVEADLLSCPGSLAALARSTEAEWVPDAVANPKPDGELFLVLHADRIRVEIEQYARVTTYDGWIADRSPAAWAIEMTSALETCWKPASGQPPWLRPG